MRYLIALLFLLSTSIASANTGNDFVSEQAVPINSLMITISTLIGLALFGGGISDIAKNGKMPQQYPMANAAAKMFTGTLMLSLNVIYSIFVNTTTGGSAINNSALAIEGSSLMTSGYSKIQNSSLGMYLPEQTVEIIFSMIFLVGLYSFISGIYSLKDLGTIGQGGNQQSPVKKSIVHIVAGMIAMNIVDFSCIVGTTIGIPQICGS